MRWSEEGGVRWIERRQLGRVKRHGGRGMGRVEGSRKVDERVKVRCEKETCERVTEVGEFVAGREDEAEDGGDKDRVGDAFRGLENTG